MCSSAASLEWAASMYAPLYVCVRVCVWVGSWEDNEIGTTHPAPDRLEDGVHLWTSLPTHTRGNPGKYGASWNRNPPNSRICATHSVYEHVHVHAACAESAINPTPSHPPQTTHMLQPTEGLQTWRTWFGSPGATMGEDEILSILNTSTAHQSPLYRPIRAPFCM